MQVPRPLAVGDQSVVSQLRSVLFSEPILGAAGAWPIGLIRAAVITVLTGWFAPLLARRATHPLPPTRIYVALTPVDLRLFSKPAFGDPFEIGRWKRGSYRASSDGGRVDLELDRLGRIQLRCSRDARPVIDLIVEGAAGPLSR